MRLVLVVPGGVDASGTERVIPALLALIERLARRHALRVVALAQGTAPSTYRLLGATVHDLALGGRLVTARALPRFLRVVRAADADVVHAFWAAPAGFLAAAATRLLGVPSLVHLGGGELAVRPEIGYGGLLSLRDRAATLAALSGATRISAASGPIREAARSLGFDVACVPLGVDPTVFEPAAGARSPGPPRLLFVGSLNAVKDPETLLRAFERILREEPAARLTVAGVDTTGGRIPALFGDRVTYLGHVRPTRIAELLRETDLLLVTSRHEAGPLVVLEAAAAGVPTVGTAVGHVLDLAPHAAVAVPIGDDGALAAHAVRLLRDGAERERLGTAAREWAVAHDADATAAAFESIYREIRSR